MNKEIHTKDTKHPKKSTKPRSNGHSNDYSTQQHGHHSYDGISSAKYRKAGKHGDEYQYTIGYWNIKGWYTTNTPEQILNNQFRKECIINSNCDILGLTETHLGPNEQIIIPGFKWFGHSRSHTHRKAPHAFGGVGFLI